MGEEERYQLQSQFGICPDMAPQSSVIAVDQVLLRIVAGTMILGKQGHVETGEKGSFNQLFIVTWCMCEVLCKIADELRHTKWWSSAQVTTDNKN